MASVRKLDPGDPKSPWVVEYTDAAGKRRRKTPKSGLKKDADALRKKVEAEVDGGVHTARSDSITVRELCDSYLRFSEDCLRDGRIGAKHFARVKTVCDTNIIPLIGRKKVPELTRASIEELYTNLCRNGRLIPRSAKSYLIMFKVILDFAMKHGWAKQNPVKEFMPEIRGIPRAQVKVFTVEEVRRLVAASCAPKRWRCSGRWDRLIGCMISAAAFCGLRYGEIIGLQVDKIDFERHLIKVRHSMEDGTFKLKGPKTRAGVRDVPMPRALATQLKAWLQRDHVPNSLDLIFTQRTGTVIGHRNFYRQQWMPLLKRAGLGEGFHFHALRHFAASWMVDRGMPITDVAKALGHSHFDMTLQVYAHPMLGAARHLEIADQATDQILALPPVRQKCDLPV